MSAVEVLFTGRSQRILVNASQKAFAPTRNHPNARLLDGNGQELLTREATRDAQSAAGLPFEAEVSNEPEVHTQFIRNARIILHAMDKDRKKAGWAGHCPDLFDERVPMHLEKNLKPETIFGKDEIVGDIVLTTEENDDGKMTPKEFLLVIAYM